MNRIGLALTTALLALAVAAPSASATFPGKPGQIVFSSLDRADDQRLYRINPSGGTVREAPFDGFGPAYSADGRSVAFNRGELRVADADGTGERIVAPTGFAPAWSPNGREIAYSRVTEDDYEYLEIVDVATGAIRLVAQQGGPPSWSPDGKLIVFESSKERELCVIRPDGSGRRCPAAATKLGARDPEWSPDGRSIAVAAGTRIAVLRRDGSFARWLSPPIKRSSGDIQTRVFNPYWSPSGRHVVYERGKGFSRGSLYITSYRGGRQRYLTGGVNPVWSPRP